MNYAVSSLITGINNGVAFSNDGGGNNSVSWMSDSTGSFARINWTSGGTAGLRWYFPDSSHRQVYVKMDLRRQSFQYNTKQLKILGMGVFTGSGYSNFTFGPQVSGYSGGTTPGVAYSDQTGGGDNSAEPPYSGYTNAPATGNGGAFTRTPYPTQTVVSNVVQDLNWHTWEFFVHYNDDNSNNGEIAVWLDGKLVFHYTNVWNCGTGLQQLGAIGIGEYSGMPNAIEDYRNFYVSYDRPNF